jgi:hypothetical protein
LTPYASGTIVAMRKVGASKVARSDCSVTAMTRPSSGAISGFARYPYEPVRQAFTENFARRRELGGACCVYRHGDKIIDLWGGTRNKQTGEL